MYKKKLLAGGLIAGAAGKLLKQVMKSPRLKEKLAKHNVTKKIKEYQKRNISEGLKVSPGVAKTFARQDAKMNKSFAIGTELFKYKRKNLVKDLFEDFPKKNTSKRNTYARVMKTERRLRDYNKSMKDKHDALVVKKLFKIKEN